ncbi:hypothetical protein SEA_ZETA1847_67 [Microbacterium phage Zeta1847]|uniref:Uncharacterized protein n=1 Tax=Microbacterium phage Zeta1847 TaxID=2201444 RepID=A0A2Z4Q9N4_9CAUD|nr:hypothetical protein HOT46_gp67 [Microbacterium phage Zeta1847]AWY06701.1 hypothetical protein SEA_ZETA1847_67 [Microbacterium phage Zeta1847]
MYDGTMTNTTAASLRKLSTADLEELLASTKRTADSLEERRKFREADAADREAKLIARILAERTAR